MSEANIKYDNVTNINADCISRDILKKIIAIIENRKITIKAQSSNPKMLTGEKKRHIVMKDCFKRHMNKISVTPLQRENAAN